MNNLQQKSYELRGAEKVFELTNRRILEMVDKFFGHLKQNTVCEILPICGTFLNDAFIDDSGKMHICVEYTPTTVMIADKFTEGKPLPSDIIISDIDEINYIDRFRIEFVNEKKILFIQYGGFMELAIDKLKKLRKEKDGK